MIVGQETCPSTSTPHLQIYLELKKKTTLTGVKKLLGSTAVHLEMARGTWQDNQKYCSKEKVFLEVGTPNKQGRRHDLEEVKSAIDEGMTHADLWNFFFKDMVKYRKSFEEYANILRSKKREMPKVYIWWGATGTGKTKGAFELAEREFDDDFWVWPGGNWFDGYRGQRVAIFDEFHGGENQIDFPLWKKLCDRYPLTVPVKGSFTNWGPEVIIFTSNVNPKNWWPEERKPEAWWDQFERRTSEIKEFI